MEIFKCGLHVLAAGFLVITFTITYAANVTGKVKQEIGTNRDNETNTLGLNNLSKILEDNTYTSPTSPLTISSTISHTPSTFVTSDANEQDDDGDDDDVIKPHVVEDPEEDPYATKTIPFRKCCAKHESFNASLKCAKRKRRSPKDVDIAEDDLVGKKYSWFPTLIISGSKSPEPAYSPNILNVSRIDVQYRSMPKCEESERLILQWYKEEMSFFFIFASNGTIVEINPKSMETVAMWPVDSYCMDSVPSNEYSYYVAFLCPCLHKICVRKCCPRGFYYNETYNACNEFKNLNNDYKPSFFKGQVPFKKSVPYYLLRRMPVCGGRKIETLYSPKKSLFIQKNGSLLIRQNNGKWDVINNSIYCSDYFIDQRFREKVTNVLFCIQKSNRYQKYFSAEIHLKSEGDFFTLNFFLFLTVIVFVVIYE